MTRHLNWPQDILHHEQFEVSLVASGHACSDLYRMMVRALPELEMAFLNYI